MRQRRHRRAAAPKAEAAPKLECNACGKRLKGLKLYYRVKTQITCEPNEVVFTDEDMKTDYTAEMERLSREAAGRDEDELQDEVFVLLDYFLCASCKKSFVRDTRK